MRYRRSCFQISKIMVKENAYLAFVVREIFDANLSKKDVFMARNRIIANDFEFQLFIRQSNIRNKCFRKITKFARPIIRKNPRKTHRPPKRQIETEIPPYDFPARHAENKCRGSDIYRQMLPATNRCQLEYRAYYCFIASSTAASICFPTTSSKDTNCFTSFPFLSKIRVWGMRLSSPKSV